MAVFFDSVIGLQNSVHLGEQSGAMVKHFYCLDILWKKLQTEFNFVARFPALLKQRASYSDIKKRRELWRLAFGGDGVLIFNLT
jgi:hypothetical protein